MGTMRDNATVRALVRVVVDAACFFLKNLSVRSSRVGRRRDCSKGRASKDSNDKGLAFRGRACLLSVFCDQVQGKAAGIPSVASGRAGTEDIRTLNMVLSLFFIFLMGGSMECAWGSFPVDSNSSYSCNIFPWITCPSYRSYYYLDKLPPSCKSINVVFWSKNISRLL